MISFTCRFVFLSREYSTSSLNGIRDFCDGFWVDKDMHLTRGLDGQYWIPPGQILYIEKGEDKSEG